MSGVGNLKVWAALVATVGAALVLLVTATGTVHATFPGDNGQIAFTSNRTGDLEIFRINPDGSHPVNVTRAPAVEDRRPSYSANGQRIVYDAGSGSNDQEIYTMRGSGRLQTRLTINGIFDNEPTFSRDGSKIAFSSNRITGSTEKFVMNSDGSNVRKLTDAVGAGIMPAWSPNGKKIAFVTNRDDDYEIFVMNADGSGERRLTKNTFTEYQPGWSPDGKKIVFTTNRTGDYEVFRMGSVDTNNDGNGDNPKNLSDTPGQDLDPVYSPSGTRIAFQSNRDGDGEILVMNATTGAGQQKLTNNGVLDFEPTWQPLP